MLLYYPAVPSKVVMRACICCVAVYGSRLSQRTYLYTTIYIKLLHTSAKGGGMYM